MPDTETLSPEILTKGQLMDIVEKAPQTHHSIEWATHLISNTNFVPLVKEMTACHEAELAHDSVITRSAQQAAVEMCHTTVKHLSELAAGMESDEAKLQVAQMICQRHDVANASNERMATQNQKAVSGLVIIGLGCLALLAILLISPQGANKSPRSST